jgi:hypothetical protein
MGNKLGIQKDSRRRALGAGTMGVSSIVNALKGKDTRVKQDPARKAARGKASAIKKTARTMAKGLRKAGNSGQAKATRQAGRAAAKKVMAAAPKRQKQVGPKARAANKAAEHKSTAPTTRRKTR